jgi:Flp pilus assembly protein TadB
MKSDDQDRLTTQANTTSADSHAVRRYTNRIVRLSLWIACILVGILFLLGVNLGVLIPYLQVIVPLVFLVFLFTMKRPE